MRLVVIARVDRDPAPVRRGRCSLHGALEADGAREVFRADADALDVVVQITRSTLPIAGDRTEERGAVTHGGKCPANVACKTVDSATMSTIWTELGRAATIDHGPPSSPHYGGRWLEASWTEGSCAIADSQETPVTSASAPRFDAAYDAVVKPFR